MKLWRQAVAQANKLDEEYDLLERMRDIPMTKETQPEHVRLLLMQAKRVRRETAELVRILARWRDEGYASSSDKPTSQEATR